MTTPTPTTPSTTIPATITITDAIPNPNHDLFTVTFNTTHHITTTVTSDPTTVSTWLSSLTPITTTTTTTPLLVGLDIEWRPNFSRQSDNPVATLQLCTTTAASTNTFSCLIFQILYSPQPLPTPLHEFLSNENITFVGVGIRTDVEQLLIDYELNVKNVVDLGELAVEKISGARKGMGLKELSKVVMGVDVKKPKNVSLSRWDSEWLSYQQIQYACIDAFLSFQIGSNLMSLVNVS